MESSSDAVSGSENADESSEGAAAADEARGGLKRKRECDDCVCSKCGRSWCVPRPNAEEDEDEDEDAARPQEPMLCNVCMEAFGPSLGPYSSRCGHLLCKHCINKLQTLAKSSTGDSRFFKCPVCRASRQTSNYFRLNLDSYTTTSDGRWINLRLQAREHKEVLARNTKQLKALIEAESTFLKGLPKTLSSGVVGKATIANNRANICEQFASSDRKVKLEAVLFELEKVEVALGMAGASLHKLEADAKHAENVQEFIKRACEKEEAKRAKLDERLIQAKEQRRKAEKELREFERSSAALSGLGSQTSQSQPSGEDSSILSRDDRITHAHHLGVVQRAMERIHGSGDLGSDYEVVWLGSNAPNNITQIIRARLSREGGGGEGSEGGGGGGGGGSSV